MTAVGLRQLSQFALAVSLVTVGALGLAEIVTPGPVLAAVLLATAVVLAFDAGRQFTRFG